MPPTAAESPPRVVRQVVLRPWMLLVLLLVPAVLTWWPALRTRGPVGPVMAPTRATLATPGEGSGEVEIREGPWGRLELTPMVIQPPVRYVPVDHYSPAPLRWRLGRLAAPEVPAWLAEHGLPADLPLVTDAAPRGVPPETSLRPSPALVRGLAPESRARIYRELLRLDARNEAFLGNQLWSAAQWRRLRSKLPAAVVAVVDDMVVSYGENGDVRFWDLRAAMHFLPAETDRLALVRAFHQQPTYLLNLVIDGRTPVQEMADYWRLPSTRRQIVPMLESLVSLATTSRIDALHLMSPVIRELAYTYPVAALDDLRGDLPDCYWTCANFDRPPGQPEIPGDSAASHLMTHYAPFLGRPEFGDLLILRDADDEGVHAAVYVAADILFTKNGQHPLVPWVFMAREDLLRAYGRADPARTLWVRRKAR
jgi:hypothetical protein